MKTIKIFGKDVCSCVIIRIVLSTLAIITLFYLTSCVTPSSVRGNKISNLEVENNENDRLEKRKKVEDNRDEEFAELMKEVKNQDIIKDTLIEKNQELSTQELSNLLLPLNKQVELLGQNQTQIKNDISKINSDVSVMKQDISEIKATLNMLSNHGLNSIASTGVEELEEDVSPKKTEKFVMKSDQEADKSSTEKDKKEEPVFVVKANSNKNNKLENQNKVRVDEVNDKEVKDQINTNNQISDLNKLSFELTESYLQNKDFSKAISKLKEIESGLKTELEKTKHNYLLGESHFGLKQYAKAIEYFIKVLESPDFEDKENAKVMIAESQIKNGETESAKQTFKQLIADYPESKFIPRARKMLQKL